jgi:peptidoglycan/LPS O-acetylase OafA/YrhL
MARIHMFRLDRSSNDTSATLDFIRATAAQLVCVGHAINFGQIGRTFVPNDGVMLFFILSGFLIAFTLDTKSAEHHYSIVDFGIERASRIYTAYLPALLLIGAATILAQRCGIEMKGDPTDLRTFIGNLTMRQNLPSDWGVSTFGTAGHLTSVAVEFHIYFFVGAIYFLVIGRNLLLPWFVAFLSSTMPLAYFSAIPGSDRSMFVLWLLGFGSYYVVKSIRDYGAAAPLALVAFPLCTAIWLAQRTPGDDFNLRQYPMLTLAFFSLVVVSQSTKFIRPQLSRLITFAAEYSFSLFLVHLTIIRVIYALIPSATYWRAMLAISVANLSAIIFANMFERHYRGVAFTIKKAAGRITCKRSETASLVTAAYVRQDESNANERDKRSPDMTQTGHADISVLRESGED